MITLRKNYEQPTIDIAYSNLLERAFNQLRDNNLLSEIEANAGKFTSMESYFAHMEQLVRLNKNYLLLPLDEAPFEINANTRTITVPADFNKCAGVQNDEMCEIITFTIDRYFDYMDLNNTFIAVQWVNAAKEEGIHYVSQLKDLDTYKGKIRFGWPLTSDVTKEAGDVIFSVRFFVKDGTNVTNPEEANSKNTLKYILNTLPAKITIKPSLNIEDPDFEETNVDSLFLNFIKNSMNPILDIPLSPSFGTPGLDLPKNAAINLADNKLILEVQATASDSGDISYKWYYTPSDGSAKILITGNETDEDGKLIYTLDNEYFKQVEWPNGQKIRQGGEKYYKDVNGAKEPYNGPIDNESPDLFERYSQLTINDSKGLVTGEYYVEAVNTIWGPPIITPDGEELMHNDAAGNSSTCKILAPNPIAIVEGKDIPARAFLPKGDNAEYNLSLALTKDPTAPTYKYDLYKVDQAPEGEASFSEIIKTETTTENSFSHKVDEPGWYMITATSMLNRTEEDVNSTICKLTNLPTIPEETKFKLSERKVNGEWVENTDWDGEETKFTYNFGEQAQFKVEAPDDFAKNPLLVEELQYVWYIQKPDSDIDVLTEQSKNDARLPVVDGLGTNTLTVRSIGATADEVYAYYCEVINDFAGLPKKEGEICSKEAARCRISEPFIVKYKAAEPEAEEEV